MCLAYSAIGLKKNAQEIKWFTAAKSAASDSQSSKESIAHTETFARMNELTKSDISELHDIGNISLKVT